MRNVDPTQARAVREAAARLARLRPGKAIELRIPPYAAVQLGAGEAFNVPGPVHRRGTPPTVVETDPATFLALVNGELTWADALKNHQVSASGTHADLSELFGS